MCPTAPRPVDMHAHLFPRAYLDLIRDHGARFGAEYADTPAGPRLAVGPLKVGPIGPSFTDLDARLAVMDRQGVAVQAMALTQPMVYWPDESLSADLSAAYNDACDEAHRRHPRRLVGLASLPMLHPRAALRELDRVARLPGIRGVGLATTVGDTELSDPLFWPVLALIEELGLPVVLHPLKVVGHERLERAHYLNNLLGNPFDTAVAAARLIFDGVLDRFPRLEVNLPHAGGALPILIGRLDRGWTVARDKAGRPPCERPPRDYLRRFTYDTIGHAPEVIRYLVDLVGADRIVLGSDHCFDMGDHEPVRFVEGLGFLDAAQRAQVMEGTAAELLRLDIPEPAGGSAGAVHG